MYQLQATTPFALDVPRLQHPERSVYGANPDVTTMSTLELSRYKATARKRRERASKNDEMDRYV